MYGEVKELLPGNSPTPLVNCVSLTRYVDANLFHYQIPGCSVTGVLHLFNKPQWVGILRNIVLLRHPHVVLSLFLPVYLWNI